MVLVRVHNLSGRARETFKSFASFIFKGLKPHHGVNGTTDAGLCPGNHWLRGDHRHVCLAYVEGQRLHWSQHCDGADYLGRFMDDLCHAEHWPDAVQNLWFSAGSSSGSPGCQSSCGHCYHDFFYGGYRRHCWRKVHQLCGGTKIQSQSGHCCGSYLHLCWCACSHPCMLVCQQHRPRFLQPYPDKCPEERDWGCTLHWLGHSCTSNPGWCPPLQLLPTQREPRVSSEVWRPQVHSHQPSLCLKFYREGL